VVIQFNTSPFMPHLQQTYPDRPKGFCCQMDKVTLPKEPPSRIFNPSLDGWVPHIQTCSFLIRIVAKLIKPLCVAKIIIETINKDHHIGLIFQDGLVQVDQVMMAKVTGNYRIDDLNFVLRS